MENLDAAVVATEVIVAAAAAEAVPVPLAAFAS